MRAYFKTYAVARRFCEAAEKNKYARTSLYRVFSPFAPHDEIDGWVVFYSKRR